MTETTNVNTIEIIGTDLEQNDNEFANIRENEINRSSLRSKANIVAYSERNSKYFASPEKKISESKLITMLQINDKINRNQNEILEATESIYKKLYERK